MRWFKMMVVTRYSAIMPRFVTSLVAFFVFAFCTMSQAAFPWENLELKGAVNDYAGLLRPNEQAALESKLGAYFRSTGNALVLVTIADLDGGNIDDAANRIFARAGVGKKGVDNGALLLVSLKDRKMWIEVGYGLEGTLTDAKCGEILRHDIVPSFRSGNYYAGLDTAFTNMEKIVGGDEAHVTHVDGQGKLNPFVFLFSMPIIILLLIIGRIQSKNPNARRGVYVSQIGGFGGGFGRGGGFGGGGGGGFGGFGGGMSGGGGASGSW